MKKLVYILLLLSFKAFSGINEFPTGHEEYLKELEIFMKASNREEAETQANKFIRSYKVMQSISEGQLDTIIVLTNLMKVQRMSAYPHFTQLFEVINKFKGKQEATLSMDTWLDVTVKMLSSSKRSHLKEFSMLIDLANSLLDDDLLYSSTLRNFKTTSKSYDMRLNNSVLQVIIPKLDLLMYNNTGDTIIIHDTKGIYYPEDQNWEGEYGKITWRRAGLDPNETYCEFKKYKINCNESDFKIDTVDFHYDAFLKGRVLQGAFEDKLISNNSPENSSYPRFESFDNDITLNKIIESLHYKGGFTLHGSKTIGSGGLGKDAIIEVYTKSGKLAVKSVSKIFIIDEQKGIFSTTAATTIYIEQDSITHPGVTFKFDIENRLLTLRRGNTSIGKSSFYNSYHEMEMYPEVILWYIDQPIMEFEMTTGAGMTDAVFQSSDYFDPIEFDKYQNIADYNPISVIRKYSVDNNAKIIFADELAKKMNPRFSVENIRGLLYKLVEDGFIDYDQEKELVIVKDKVEKYVLANRGLIDFDAIKIVSNSQEGNGTLNLETFDLDIKGVPSVRLSDSKNILIKPDSNKITMKKDMDLSFSGSVGDPSTGRLEFFGEGFNLNYDSFYMDMTKIDYIKINIPDTAGALNAYGKPLTRPLNSFIENTRGTLVIDDPNNKSSNKKNPQYPSFKSGQESYVYYDDSTIHNGVYNREQFYFKLKPFKFDSLETFETESVKFQGTFVSQKIFPDIKESLGIIREDMSLGFVTKLPELGYGIYEGRGRFRGDELKLSNKGLIGKGTFTYLSSSSKSENILFLPDSLVAHLEVFDLKKAKYQDGEVPHVSTVDVDVVWKPYEDKLDVEKTDGHFLFYDQKAKFTGIITLSPNGLTGKGSMDWGDGTIIVSNEFEFEANSFGADSSDIEIKVKDSEDDIAFRTNNVKYSTDLVTNISTITKQNSDAVSEFPYVAFNTTISDILWDTENDMITLKEKVTDYAVFTSMHPDQDSLQIRGKNATYDLDENVLTITEVPDIIVADAQIILDTNKTINIFPAARFETLRNTEVVMSNDNHYNKLYNASVNIISKNKFNGNAYYDYVDYTGYTQQIHFDELGTTASNEEDSLDTRKHRRQGEDSVVYHSYAKADVNFTIAPTVLFEGKVKIYSQSKDLIFTGFSKIVDTTYSLLNSDWFNLQNDSIDPKSIYLDIKNAVNKNGRDLNPGIYYSDYEDTTGFYFDEFGNSPYISELYFNFLNTEKNVLDKPIITAEDILYIDYEKNKYIISNRQKLFPSKENSLPVKGNTITINMNDGKVLCEGAINFPITLKPISTGYAGSIRTTLNEPYPQYDFHMIAGYDIPLLSDIKGLFIKDIQELTYDAQNADYKNEFFRNNIVELSSDDKNTKKLFESIEKSGFFDLNDDLDYTFLFTNLNLKHDSTYTAFYDDSYVDVAYIDGEPVHKKIKMYIEYLKDEIEGNSLTLYFQITNQDWYFFNYKTNQVNTLSSNATYNNTLTSLKPKKRKVSHKGSKADIIYNPATEFDKQVFLDRIANYKANQ